MYLLTSYELYVTAFNAYFSNTSSKLVNDFNFLKSTSTTISESSLKKTASNFFIMDNIEVRAFEVYVLSQKLAGFLLVVVEVAAVNVNIRKLKK